MNYSQSSINKSFDTPEGKIPIEKVIRRKGAEQVEDFPVIEVVNVKGQLVAIDGNSRLYIARKTKAKKIKVVVVHDIDSLKDVNARLRKNNLPNTGTKKLPTPR